VGGSLFSSTLRRAGALKRAYIHHPQNALGRGQTMKTTTTTSSTTKTFAGFASAKAILAAASKIAVTCATPEGVPSLKKVKRLRGFACADGSLVCEQATTNLVAIQLYRILHATRKLRACDIKGLANVVMGQDIATAGTEYNPWYAGQGNKIRFALAAPAKAKAVKASKPKAKATKAKASSALTEAANELQAGKPVIITNVQGGEETIGSVEELLTFALAQRDLANKPAKAKVAKQVPVTIRLA
jgi:hypothetical protein